MLRKRAAARRRLDVKRATQKTLRDLEQALEGLKIPDGVPREIASALAQHGQGTVRKLTTNTLVRTLVCLVALVWTVWVIPKAPRLVSGLWTPTGTALVAEFQRIDALEGLQWSMALIAFLIRALFVTVLVICMTLAVLLFLMAPALATYWSSTRLYPLWTDHPAVLARRYQLVKWSANKVVAIWLAYSEDSYSAIQREVSWAVSGAQDHLLVAHRRRGIPLPRRRRNAVREHARLVVERLRVAEAGLDTDPRGSAREVALLLTTISARYAQGRIGALLDHPVVEEEDLTRIERLRRSRGVVRLLVFLTLAVGGVWGVTLLKLPDQAEGVAVISVLVLAAMLTRARVPQRVQDAVGLFAP
ncbi:hypothetical protein [Streptomyces yangpuensis]|uniref:hypothetical protein n=1 Tax=Streptomyces yangpuensis TaxID=1648182 RepID=UPI003652702E